MLLMLKCTSLSLFAAMSSYRRSTPACPRALFEIFRDVNGLVLKALLSKVIVSKATEWSNDEMQSEMFREVIGESLKKEQTSLIDAGGYALPDMSSDVVLDGSMCFNSSLIAYGRILDCVEEFLKR